MTDHPAWYVKMLPDSLDAHGDVAPAWARCPEIPFGSIGWRMGYGESWLMLWWRWLEDQPTDRDRRARYLRRHPPAPRRWARAVVSVLEPGRQLDEVDDDKVDGALVARLRTEGFIGSDVAQGAWEAQQGPTPAAPWSSSRSMADAARYGGRELTFWARWCARRREQGALAGWLAEASPAPQSWRPLRRAVETGVVPEGHEPASAWERLAVLVVAHGWPPPPWVLGQPPSSLREDYDDDDASYADAWSLWVGDALDDDAMWRAYVERYEPIPADWEQPIAQSVWFGE